MPTVRERVYKYMDTHGPCKNIEVAEALGLPGPDTWKYFNDYRKRLLAEAGRVSPPSPAETLPVPADDDPARDALSGETTLPWAYVVQAPNGQWCRLVPLDE